MTTHPRNPIEKFGLPILRSAASEIAVEHVVGEPEVKSRHQTAALLLLTFPPSSAQTGTSCGHSRGTGLGQHGVGLPEEDVPAGRTAPGKDRPKADPQHRATMAPQSACCEGDASDGGDIRREAWRCSAERTVRTSYEDEPSDYVRSAILFSAKYLTLVERKTCKRAWGGTAVRQRRLLPTQFEAQKMQ